MFSGMYTSASGMIAQQKMTEATNENIANWQVPSYKKIMPVFQSFKEVMDKVGNEIYENPLSNQVRQSDIKLDYTTGPLKHTNNDFDIALEGKGFFTVETDKGLAYTRKGTFTLDKDGILTTDSGFKVQGKRGDIKIPDNAVQVSITEEGDIYTDNVLLDSLKLANFNEPYKLNPIGFNAYVPSDPKAPIKEPENLKVMQGYLEDSNVNILEEMVNMIQSQRFHEIGSNVLTKQDSLFAALIKAYA